MSELLNELEQKGLIHDIANGDELGKLLSSEKISYYCGFDPTADSLHVGSMLPLMLMRRLQNAGHKPIALLGSATGLIGDPSGKSEERNLLSEENVRENAAGIKKQISRILSTKGKNACEFVENSDWIGKLSSIEFLRDVGKHFSVNAMVQKDSVRSRLENREQGISYTEFSYMLLQAYDFYWLYQNKNCRLQVGGSDQWGNITAGLELIRRKTTAESAQAFGFTFPLITSSSGQKFGKTEAGNVWLDAQRTSPYQFFQFWLNTADEDVETYLKFFTELEDTEIAELSQATKDNPAERRAQRRLAEEVSKLIHGKEEVSKAIEASKVLFGGELANISASTLREVMADVPSAELAKDQLSSGLPLIDLMAQLKVTSSKGEAKRLLEGGGVYLNNKKIEDQKATISGNDFIDGEILLLRTGKKKYFLISLS